MIQKSEVSFIFPGQGSQFIGMGKDFATNFPVSKAVFDEVDDTLGVKLSEIIFEGSEAELKKTENAQSGIMAVSIAILKALESETGKKIEGMAGHLAGHSLGEYSALCASGAISLKQTAILLRKRGDFMAKSYKGGAMLAIIGLEEKAILALIEKVKMGGVLVIANDNANGQIVLSGNEDAIERARLAAIEMKAKMAIKLDVSGPFHSPLLETASFKMKGELERAEISLPKIPVINNVFVQSYTSVAEIKDVLARQITSKVRWRETIIAMENIGIKKTVEIGPGKVLSGLTKRTAPGILSCSINSILSINEFIKTL